MRCWRHAQPGHVGAIQKHAAAFDLAQVHDRLGQFGLAIAIDARDAENFAGMNFETQAANFFVPGFIAGRASPRFAESARRVFALDLSARRFTSRPTISRVNSCPDVEPIARVATTCPSRITVTRSAISMISFSLCVTSTTERPSSRSLRRTANSWSFSCGRQHGGGLVENQQPRIAIQKLQNLDSLLHADRQRSHFGRRIEREPVAIAQFLQFFRGALQIEQRAASFPQTEHCVFHHRESPHQHEFLMHHADAERDRVFRAAEAHRFAIDQNFSGVHRVEAVENLHQRAFAGAVFAEQRVNFARLNRQIDVVVREHAGEALYDVLHFQGMLHRSLLQEAADRKLPSRNSHATENASVKAYGHDDRVDIDLVRCDVAPHFLESAPLFR